MAWEIDMFLKQLGNMIFGFDVEGEMKRLRNQNALVERRFDESEKRRQDLEAAMRDVIGAVERSVGIYVTNRTLFELMFEYVRRLSHRRYLYLHVDDVTSREAFETQILTGLGVTQPMKWNEALAAFISLSSVTPIVFLRIDSPPNGDFKAVANGLRSWQQGRNIKIILYSAWKAEHLGSFLETVSVCMGLNDR